MTYSAQKHDPKSANERSVKFWFFFFFVKVTLINFPRTYLAVSGFEIFNISCK